jgi:UDP-N-acetylglucosamine 2-epimerase (non-hydrolysing)
MKELTMKICIVLGTRPEIIKFSPFIRECLRLQLDHFVIHTGQHYSYNLDKVFFDQLGLPDADHNLEVGSGTHAEQTARMLIGIERILSQKRPNVVLVEGDTNTVLAGALSSVKLCIKLGHVEAGLRSYDREMPEEINRIVADHCSDLLFAPTVQARTTLLGEGIDAGKIYVTGNTIVDAVYQNIERSVGRRGALDQLGLHRDNYFLATIHRQENVDNKERFLQILTGLEMVAKKFDIEVVYPVHPRAKRQMATFGLKIHKVRLIDPLDYLSFLQLEKNARVVFTDSGGVQEETCIMKVPCVTLRYNTERPETVHIGSNVLVGTNPQKILEGTEHMIGINRDWENPFGDGRAAERIAKIIETTKF